jgi:hypothetical protein
LDIAGWVAPIATMVAAIMTAANLGSRVTGWGFAVFAVGAVAWIVVGLGSGQQNLVVSNAFLLVVDLVGVWRWLGQRARYDAGAAAAVERSNNRATASSLLPISRLDGMALKTADGTQLATVVDAMAECHDGRIAYLVVRRGGIGGVGETLHAVDWSELHPRDTHFEIALNESSLERRGAIDPEAWPSSPVAARGR